jgi:hypothetical protein
MKKLAFLILFALSNSAYSADPNFDFFCSQLLQKNPTISNYSDYFTDKFQKAISLEYLKSIFTDAYTDTGACVSYSTESISPNDYILKLNGEKNLDIVFTVTFDHTQRLFSGLLINGIQDPSIEIKRWTDVGNSLNKLDPNGKLSATLMTSDGSIDLLHNSDDVFAIGSTFKLYILGALELAISNGLHNWNVVLPVKEDWKSLPSGIMHTWPAGQPVKIYEYAEKMISISDNTATDHLLYFLGRENVEKMLFPMGNIHEYPYLPFLSTLEMFKLKWAIKPSETLDYIGKNKTERLSDLENLKLIPRTDVGKNGVNYNKPTHIDTIEWFATTKENCNAMFWLAKQNKSEIRSILSKNVPLLVKVGSEESHWAFAGFKGGSEPGVLSTTFLLESKKGNRACLSMSWNNQTENVSLNRFIDIVNKTLKFSETQIP